MAFPLPKLKFGNCVAAFLASGLQAFGMYNIHALSGVTEGGVFGVVLLLNHWLHLSPAVSSFFLNAACYALGWRTLGRTFIAILPCLFISLVILILVTYIPSFSILLFNNLSISSRIRIKSTGHPNKFCNSSLI